MPKRLNFTREQEHEIAKMYRDGLSSIDISRKLKIASATVFRILRDCGEPARTASQSSSLRSSMKPSGQYSGRSGVFWSSKSQKWIPTASTYEYIRMDQLDRDSSVLMFSRCQDRIRYSIDGNQHHYTPDITVNYVDGRTTVEEIKPRALASRSIVLIKAKAAANFYEPQGIKYLIVTEDQIGDDAIKSFDWSGIEKVNKDHVEAARKEEIRKRQSEWMRKKRAATTPTPEQRRIHADQQRARYHEWRSTATPDQIQKHREAGAAYMRERRRSKIKT